VGIVAIGVGNSTTDHHLYFRFAFCRLGKITIMSGHDDYGVVRVIRVRQNQLLHRLVREQVPLSPWRLSRPLRHSACLSPIVFSREIGLSRPRERLTACKSSRHHLPLIGLRPDNLHQ